MASPWKYRDEHTGPSWHYRSTLRPVASIGYDRIPALLLEPTSDPAGDRRDFWTYEPLPDDVRSRWDIVNADD